MFFTRILQAFLGPWLSSGVVAIRILPHARGAITRTVPTWQSSLCDWHNACPFVLRPHPPPRIVWTPSGNTGWYVAPVSGGESPSHRPSFETLYRAVAGPIMHRPRCIDALLRVELFPKIRLNAHPSSYITAPIGPTRLWRRVPFPFIEPAPGEHLPAYFNRDRIVALDTLGRGDTIHVRVNPNSLTMAGKIVLATPTGVPGHHAARRLCPTRPVLMAHSFNPPI